MDYVMYFESNDCMDGSETYHKLKDVIERVNEMENNVSPYVHSNGEFSSWPISKGDWLTFFCEHVSCSVHFPDNVSVHSLKRFARLCGNVYGVSRGNLK